MTKYMDKYLSLRRYRRNNRVRDMFATVSLESSHLIQPYFVYEHLNECVDLPSINGQKKHNYNSLKHEVEIGLKNGINKILLFIIPAKKCGQNFNYQFGEEIISNLKREFGDNIILFVDVCLCSHTETGHCGIVVDDEVVNDLSVAELVKQATAYALAGADVISPSDMMDNRILAIRSTLDEIGKNNTIIMGYSTKFSSNFYGPFRDAAESAPSHGDRKSYQIDFRNENDALLSSMRDMEQGADILMVKPAGNYLDIIKTIKDHEQTGKLALAAYQVSGEYQSLYLMSEAGYLNFEKAYLETLFAIKRSGADLIITYGANQFRRIYEENI